MRVGAKQPLLYNAYYHFCQFAHQVFGDIAAPPLFNPQQLYQPNRLQTANAAQVVALRPAELRLILCLWENKLGRGKGFNTANEGLQINKKFGKMRSWEERRRLGQEGEGGGSGAGGETHASTCMLLPAIKDQQIYLGLMGTFLTLAREAHAPPAALDQLASALLSARGLHPSSLLRPPQSHTASRPYDALSQGWSRTEMRRVLERVEAEAARAREAERAVRCLERYRRAKEEEIAGGGAGGAGSRKERFRRGVAGKYARRAVQSSDFYAFGALEILQNSFRGDNNCYRTLASFTRLKTLYGHASDQDPDSFTPVYNAIFDQTEALLLTSGEEGLIKVWHRPSATLVASLKGHTDFINKIEASRCNKYLLSCGGDGVRFFDLRTLQPLGGWRAGSIEEIVSFAEGQGGEGRSAFLFGESSELYVLREEVMLGKSSGALGKEDFIVFSFAELVGRDNAAIIVISLSPEGRQLLVGLDTGHLLVVSMDTLREALVTAVRGDRLTLIGEAVRAHHQEIIEVKWGPSGHVWATGSKDGRCLLWELRGGQASLTTTLSVHRRGKKRRTFSCTYICWNCTYSHFAAGFQENVEDEETERGQGEVLVYSVAERRVTCELSRDISLNVGGIRAMDAHPSYPNILLICESEGHVLLFDLFLGCIVNLFEERGYHLLHPQFSLVPTECRFTRDGLAFIVATEYGSVSLYGYDAPLYYATAPTEQFLETDFAEFRIEEGSMRAVALTLDFQDDINAYPRGNLRSIKGEDHAHALRLEPQALLHSIHRPQAALDHRPQAALPATAAHLAHALREAALLDLAYQKSYEDIENSKQFTLFHERERQFARINALTADRLDRLAPHPLHHAPQHQQEPKSEEPSRTRKLKRHAQLERVNYADDFEYHDSQEEDFEAAEQELPDDIDDDEEEEEEEDSEPHHEHPRRRRPERTRLRRLTRRHHPQDSSESRMPTRSRNAQRHREDGEEDRPADPAERMEEPAAGEDSEQPKKYSRLRKQAEWEEEAVAVDCYRCQLVRATQFCDRCEYGQQFCQECAAMRGRRHRDKYQCLICLFLRNDAPEEHELVNELPYRVTQPLDDPYLPQLGHRVRFFFQGYEEFLVQNIDRLNNAVAAHNPNFRLLPHTEDLRLLNAPLCTVTSASYHFPLKVEPAFKRNPAKPDPLPILMLLGLTLLPQPRAAMVLEGEEGAEQPEMESEFWVYYMPGQEFLVGEWVVGEAMERGAAAGLSTNQLVQVREEEMQIVEISPLEDRYPESIWKLIKIRKTEGKRLRGNTKEIERRVNAWRLTDTHPHRPPSALPPPLAQRLQAQLERWVSEDSPYCPFVDYVDFEIYPLYRNHIPVGICLLTILERLRNHYYSSEASLRADFDLIYANSETFNGKNHFITEQARHLHTALCALLSDDPPPEPLVSAALSLPKRQEDSSSRREKRQKKEGEDDVDPSYELTAKRRTRRQDQPKTRKRQESSDYNDSEASLDEEMGVATRGLRSKPRQDKSSRITRSRAKN